MYLSVLYIITYVIRRSVKCQPMCFVNVIRADIIIILFLGGWVVFCSFSLYFVNLVL